MLIIVHTDIRQTRLIQQLHAYNCLCWRSKLPCQQDYIHEHACMQKKQDLKNCQKSKTKPASLAKAAEGLAPGAVEPAAGDLAHGPGRRFGPMTRGLNK